MAKRNGSQIFFGIILICLGLVFLLNSLGLLPVVNWLYLANYWPLLLIYFGLNILLRDTKAWWLVPFLLIATIIFLLFYGNLFDNNFDFNRNLRDSNLYQSSMEMNDNLRQLEVDIKFGGGSLRLEPIQDNKLYQTALFYRQNKPRVVYHLDQKTGIGSLIIQRELESNWGNFSEDNWQVYLVGNVPVHFEIDAGAGRFDLDLEEINTESLVLNVGAGDLDLELGNYSCKVDLNSGAAKVDIEIPEEVGLKINSSGVISQNNFIDAGLQKTSDNAYLSPNYAEAENIIEIKITASASQIDLKYGK